MARKHADTLRIDTLPLAARRMALWLSALTSASGCDPETTVLNVRVNGEIAGTSTLAEDLEQFAALGLRFTFDQVEEDGLDIDGVLGIELASSDAIASELRTAAQDIGSFLLDGTPLSLNCALPAYMRTAADRLEGLDDGQN